MANVILTYPLSDSAALTGAPAPASMPVTNLQTKEPQEVYRILDPANGFINIDTGGIEIDLICLLKHNATTRGYARVRASDTLADVESSPEYDSGNLPLRSHQSTYDTDDTSNSRDLNHFIHKLDAAVTYRYWRIDLYDTGDFLDIGRLYMSKAWQPRVNADYGLPTGVSDLSLKPRASSGQCVPLRKRKINYVEFTFSFLSEEEARGYLDDLDHNRGTTEDVLYIKDVENTKFLQKDTLYGLMANISPPTHTSFELFTKSIRIEEL